MLRTIPLKFTRLGCLFAFLFYFFLTSIPAQGQPAPQTTLPRTTLTTSGHIIDAQVAQTPAELAKGLMWRANMPENEGMLFVFDKPARQCFWMKNTYLPLSAAFITDDGIIVNIADMRPLSTQEHCSAKKVRFVLEMRQGWFNQREIEAGDHISGLESYTH